MKNTVVKIIKTYELLISVAFSEFSANTHVRLNSLDRIDKQTVFFEGFAVCFSKRSGEYSPKRKHRYKNISILCVHSLQLFVFIFVHLLRTYHKSF